MSRHVPIRDIARTLGAEAFMVLKAFFDDSGTHANSLITAIGGFVLGEAALGRAEADWGKLIDEYRQHGVTWYHAPDVASGTNEWISVPSTVRALTPMRFAKILGAYRHVPIWAAVVNEDFWNFATPEFLNAYPTPFDLCYEEALRQTYRFSVRSGNAEPIVPLFSLQTEHAQRMVDRYNEARATTDLGTHLGPIAFDTARASAPLQMADLLANQFYHEWIAREYPVEPVWSTNPVLEEATKANGAPFGGCYSLHGMRGAVERFMRTGKAS